MQDPDLYVKVNSVPGEVTKELIMTKYLKFFQWQHNNDETVLDIGCGPGNNTLEFIKPLLPSQAKLFGLDISEEMITYAKKIYPDIDFFVLDIGTRNLPEKLFNAFDHVFSSFCLHWIQDQRCVINNISRMLKPKGNMFCHYLGSCSLFDVFYNSSQMEQWKSYVNDADKYLPAFYKKESCDIEKELRNILTEIGFKIHICKVIKREFVLSNLSELREIMASIHPHMSKIPEELKKEFLDDNVKEYVRINIGRDFKDSHEFVHKFNLIILVATKL